MRPSDKFRRQHEELLKFALQIGNAIKSPDFPGNAREVRRMMAQFKGKLIVHSTMENEALYPRLLAHDDATIRARAQHLFDELATIYDAFGTHHTRWSSIETMQQDPAGYVRDTTEVLTKLWYRMGRENNELYPLADHEAGATVPSSEVPS